MTQTCEQCKWWGQQGDLHRPCEFPLPIWASHLCRYTSGNTTGCKTFERRDPSVTQDR